MRPFLRHGFLPGIFLAAISCLAAHEFSFFSRCGPLAMADGLAYAAPAQAELEASPNPEKAPVSGAQIAVTREQIEEHFREFVLKNASWKTEDLDIGPISFGPLPVLPPGQLSIEVTASPNERFIGDVRVTLHFHVDGKAVRILRVSGKVALQQEVLHSVRAMKRDEVITDADLQGVRVNVAARPDRYLREREEVVGKRLRCSIGPNQPFSPRDLEQPSLIKRGDMVTIVYQEDGIRLTTRGEAKDKGGLGDRIRIRNLDSKKNILAQVIDAQTVQVIP